MKLDVFVKQLKLPAAKAVIQFLDADKSGEIYTRFELKKLIPNFSAESHRINPQSSPELEKYTLHALANGRMRLFYGNPAVIARNRKYAVTAPDQPSARRRSQ